MTPDRSATLRATARRSTRVDGAANRRVSAAEAAQRTSAAVESLVGWHWPAWLERQRRPGHVAFVPESALGALENLTGRAATTVGTVAAGPLAQVDGAGFVVPYRGQWGLDWSVRGPERWHRPAVDATVRQRLCDDTPVVETALRVGDGDVVQRVYGVPGERDAGDLVVVEFDNESSQPVAVAVAVRPAQLIGVGVVDAVELEPSGARVNEQPALVFPRSPAAFAVGSYDLGDSLHVVHLDGAVTDPPKRTTCSYGLANGAVVFPVAHRTSLRILLAPKAPRRSVPRPPERTIGFDAAVRGWITHTRRAAVPVFISAQHASAYSIALRRLMLAVEGTQLAEVEGLARRPVSDQTRLVKALARAGLGRHTSPVLAGNLDDHRFDGWLRHDEPTAARNLAILDAVTAHWVAARDTTTSLGCLPAAVKLVQWCLRRLERGERAIAPSELARHVRLLTEIAEESEYPQTADDLRGLLPVLDWHRENEGPQANAERAADADSAARTLTTSRRGVELAASAWRIAADAAARRPEAIDALAALVEAASPTGAWPTVLHPRTLAGSAGAPDDPYVAVGLVEATLALTAVETVGPGGEITLDLLPVASPVWSAGSIDVRGIATSAGRLSYALRWHGERPALLWEIEPRLTSAGGVTVRCPGLDSVWEARDLQGEALLAGR